MSTLRRSVLLPIGLLVASVWICGQQTTPSNQASDSQAESNVDLLNITMTMDRPTYLAGEAAQVTLTITNPSANALIVWKPFTAESGCIDLLKKGDNGFRNVGEDLPCDNLGLYGNFPTLTLAAGETRTNVLNSYDPMFDLGISVMYRGGVPEEPGTYALQYTWTPKSRVEFTVVMPSLDAYTAARLPDLTTTDPQTGQTTKSPQYVNVVALRSIGETYICVEQSVRTKPMAPPRTPGQLSVSELPAIMPFKRIATSDNPVVSISASADSFGNLSIQWTDTSGVPQSAAYQASYPAGN